MKPWLAVFDGVRGEAHGRPLQAQAAPAEPVRYLGYSDEPSEASAVADEVVRLHRSGVPYREMAVLFRINAQSEAFEEALGERDVPVTLRGVEGYFQRAEVRQAVTLLRGAARAGEAGADATVDVDAPDHGRLGHEVRAVLASMGHTETAPSGPGATRDRWESLHALVTMADDLAESQPEAGLTELLADLDRRAQSAHAPTAEGVTLATLHAAKGLEWDAVFCVGMHEGMLPITHADTPQAVAEERRLFYVGVTRARRHLTISWARARKPGGRQGRKPTRFLDPLLPPDHPARGGSVGPRPKKRSNVELESLDPDARAVFERLREWRSATAAEAKVPAYVVFTDATLLALAELRPADAHGLVGIPGIGQTKRERYGEAVLEVIAQQG